MWLSTGNVAYATYDLPHSVYCKCQKSSHFNLIIAFVKDADTKYEACPINIEIYELNPHISVSKSSSAIFNGPF